MTEKLDTQQLLNSKVTINVPAKLSVFVGKPSREAQTDIYTAHSMNAARKHLAMLVRFGSAWNRAKATCSSSIGKLQRCSALLSLELESY